MNTADMIPVLLFGLFLAVFGLLGSMVGLAVWLNRRKNPCLELPIVICIPNPKCAVDPLPVHHGHKHSRKHATRSGISITLPRRHRHFAGRETIFSVQAFGRQAGGLRGRS